MASSSGKSESTASTNTTSETNKTVAIVSPDEVQWLTDMGLGRGVDATKANLWKEKSSFQVQSISESLDNIIGTDEGGARNYFEREISSISSRQTELKLSVVEPHSAVEVGVEATFSQSVTKSRKSVGEEITTRTIAFRTNFDDLPLERIDKETILRCSKFESAKPHQSLILAGKKDSSQDKPNVVKSFEEKLSDWLLDRLRIRGKAVESTEDTESSTAKVASFLCKESRDSVASDCLNRQVSHITFTPYSWVPKVLCTLKFRICQKGWSQRKSGVGKTCKGLHQPNVSLDKEEVFFECAGDRKDK